jgi:hypothetical protein
VPTYYKSRFLDTAPLVYVQGEGFWEAVSSQGHRSHLEGTIPETTLSSLMEIEEDEALRLIGDYEAVARAIEPASPSESSGAIRRGFLKFLRFVGSGLVALVASTALLYAIVWLALGLETIWLALGLETSEIDLSALVAAILVPPVLGGFIFGTLAGRIPDWRLGFGFGVVFAGLAWVTRGIPIFGSLQFVMSVLWMLWIAIPYIALSGLGGVLAYLVGRRTHGANRKGEVSQRVPLYLGASLSVVAVVIAVIAGAIFYADNGATDPISASTTATTASATASTPSSKSDEAEDTWRKAESALEASRPSEAVNLAQWAVELDPTSAHAHLVLANALAALGEFQDALGAAKEATRLDANYAFAWFSRGAIEKGLGMSAEAVSSYETFLGCADPRSDSESIAIAKAHLTLLAGEIGGSQAEGYLTVDYSDLVARPDNLKGKKVQFDGWVISVNPGRHEESIGDYTSLIVGPVSGANPWDWVIVVCADVGLTFSDGDVVLVRGTPTGEVLENYQEDEDAMQRVPMVIGDEVARFGKMP